MDLFYDEVTKTLNQDHTLFMIVIKFDPSEPTLGEFGSPGRNKKAVILLNYTFEKQSIPHEKFLRGKLHIFRNT